MLVSGEISLLVSSDPGQGALNVSADGSAFEIQLDDAIQVPDDALNVNVSVEEATVWWVVPNVLTGINDTFYIFGDDDSTPAVPKLFTVVVAQGLYDLPGLNAAVQSGLEKLGARTLDGVVPLSLINITSDDSTQRVVIRFNYPNVTVDFNQAQTMRDILGFQPVVLGPFVSAPLNISATGVAALNTVNYFLIACDLVNTGIRFNNRYNQVISQVLIDVSPGSQIISRPFNPARSDASHLSGANRSNLRFRLTDDKLRPVNTNGEYWTARVVIRYQQPYVVKTVKESQGSGRYY